MIRTSSWFTALPPGHVRIGISRGIPRRQAAGYRVYRKLAPGPWLSSVGVAEYRERYGAVLALLDPREVATQLQELAGDAVPVLVCWEAPGSGAWCHRALVATWLAEAIGEPVPELGFEHLPQHEHLMLPAAMMI